MLSSLQEIGLSEPEAQVYVSVLRLGMAKASEIAQKTNVKREAVYYTLGLLKERGFVTESLKSGVKHYGAVPPSHILQIIEEEKQRKQAAIEDILPELEKLHDTAIRRPTIEVYEGHEGFKAIFTKILEKSHESYDTYFSKGAILNFSVFQQQFRKRRAEKNIGVRSITEAAPELKEIAKLDAKELRETRFFDDLFDEDGTLFYVLDDAVIFIKANKTEQMAVYIEDAQFARMQKRIFEQMWKLSDSH